MNDQRRQALQGFQDTTQEDLNIRRLAMKDEEYRIALKTMNRKRENGKKQISVEKFLRMNVTLKSEVT